MNENKQATLFSKLSHVVIDNIEALGARQTMLALYQYMTKGNANGFTRQSGIRDRIKEMSPNEVIYALDGEPIEEFVGQLSRLNEQKIKPREVNNQDSMRIHSLISALQNTYYSLKIKNYDDVTIQNHIIGCVGQVANRNFNCITRDNDSRAELKAAFNSVSEQEFYQLLFTYLQNFGIGVTTKEEAAIEINNIICRQLGIQKEENQGKTL